MSGFISVSKLFGGTMRDSERDTLDSLDALMPFHTAMVRAHRGNYSNECVNPIDVAKSWLIGGFSRGLITEEEAVRLGLLAGTR